MDLIVNIGYENKEQLKNDLAHVIEQLSDGLKLDALEYVIISDDFASELFSFQRKRGLIEGYTKDEIGIAAGKLLSYVVDESLKQAIFLQSCLLESSKVLAPIINHELCHAHDEFIKFQLFGQAFASNLKDNINKKRSLNELLIIYANVIWSEYIANRLSRRPINIGNNIGSIDNAELINWDLKTLLDRIIYERDHSKDSIIKYRRHADINQLYSEIQKSVSRLLVAAGRFYGHLHAINNDSLNNTFYEYIETTYLEDVWDDLGYALQELYATYPKWESTSIFDNLAELVLKTLNIFGIYPEEYSSGEHYVHVPFEGWFVGSINSKKYHNLNCRWANRIDPGNLIWFFGLEEAKAAKYKPCNICKPSDHED